MSSFFKRWSSLKTENTFNKVPVVESSIPPQNNANLPSSAIQDPSSQNSELSPKEIDDSGTHPSGPQLADVEKLTAESDFSVFMNKEVAGEVHRAAMKKLFTDPHFNVMDGLDIYIDDYSIEDPLPAGMLEKMYQSDTLGLFKPIVETAEATPQPLSVVESVRDQLTTDSMHHEQAPVEINSTNPPLLSHQEQFEFTSNHSNELTKSVAPDVTDLTNTEMKNQDDHTHL